MSKTYRTLQWICFAIAFTVISFRAVNISVFNYERARNSVFGDGFSDMNTLSSAGYFLDSGFTQTSFLPMHDYFPADTRFHAVIYTHYPPLPNILAGVYATLFQTKNETVLRLVPILLSVFFFFLIFKVLNNWLADEKKAMMGAASLWLANYFICYGDNLHQHTYGELLKWLYVYLLYLYYEDPARPKNYWAWMMLIMVAEVNISFEQPVYLGIATLGFSWIYDKKVFSFTTLTAASMVAFGFGLHLWQNAVYFGSWHEAIEDMTRAYTFRATGVDVPGYINTHKYTWRDFWEIPFDWINRQERYFALPGWFLLILYLMHWKEVKAKYPRLFQIQTALFFASAAWGLVMSQHAYFHAFTGKHFGVWHALTVALFVPVYWEKAKQAFAGSTLLPKVFHTLLISYAAVMFLTQQVWEVWLKLGILFPRFGS